MFSEKVFGERVRQLREAQNLSQKTLGEVIDVSYAQISDIERGRRFTTIQNIAAMADFFNVSIDYLVGRTDNPKGGI